MTAGVEGARRGGPDAERKREYEPSLMGMKEDFSLCGQEFDVTVDMMGGLGGQSFIAASSYQISTATFPDMGCYFCEASWEALGMDYALEKSSGFRRSFPDHVKVFDLARVLIYGRLGGT